MKKILKLIMNITISTIIIMNLQTHVSLAKTPTPTPEEEETTSGFTSWDDFFKNADNAVKKKPLIVETDPENHTQETLNDLTVDTEKLRETSSVIYRLLFTIGVIIAVAIGGYLGIKFIVASVEEKAQVKEMLIPYVIGCIVIFGAFTIWRLVVVSLNTTV